MLGRDLLGHAQTCTGKTAAFGLPMLQHINLKTNKTQGLILSPTRELCLQITNEIGQYGSEIKKLNVIRCFCIELIYHNYKQ